MEQIRKKVLTFEEGCLHISYEPSYVYKLTSSKRIPFSKPTGKFIRFDVDELDEWQMSRKSITKEELKDLAAKYITKKK